MTYINKTDNSERLVTLHFPLEKLPEPIVTRLVTQFDLSPNLLRADVNAQTGGWLVLGLTGEDVRLTSALDWLRAQGLTVTEGMDGTM